MQYTYVVVIAHLILPYMIWHLLHQSVKLNKHCIYVLGVGVLGTQLRGG